MRTEDINPRYVELDSWSTAEMIAAMYEEQLAAAAAVRGALGAITAAVDDAVPALQRGGRIVYAGAGTSGRIGVQDGSELPPTFDWPTDRVVFAMAGGLDALTRSSEGAEDSAEAGEQAMTDAKIGAERRRHRHCGERHDAVHDRRAAGGDCRGRGDDRGCQQSRRAAVRGGAASHPGRDRQRGDRRLDPDEGRHRPEDRAEPVLHRRDGADGPRLSRADGGHAGAQREAAPARDGHRQRNRRLPGRRRGAPSRDSRRRPEDRRPDRLRPSHAARPRNCCSAMPAICAPRSTSPKAAMAEPHAASAMARETAEIPAAAERLLARADLFAAIAKRIEAGEAAHRRVLRTRQLGSRRRLSALSFRGTARSARIRRGAFGRDGLSAAAGHARCFVRRDLAVRAQPRPRHRDGGGAQIRRADARHRQ